jgi:ABC-2 type transport system permease protein
LDGLRLRGVHHQVDRDLAELPFSMITTSYSFLSLKANIPSFPVYLLSGLIAWNFFSGALTLSTRSIVDNTSLVKKVYFPKEILPIAAVGTALVDFVLQLGVLVVFMLAFRYSFFGWNTLLIFPAFVALMIFTLAISLWLASVNVTYRDVQHLLNLILLAWFWLTPIVYPVSILPESIRRVIELNPITRMMTAYQGILLRGEWPSWPGFAARSKPRTRRPSRSRPWRCARGGRRG